MQLKARIRKIIEIIKSWSLRRKIFSGLLAVLVILFLGNLILPNDNSGNFITKAVERTNLTQTVLATGQVTSSTDLSLSFEASGIVRSLRVQVGDKVYKGQVLATIDQDGELASLLQAQGALNVAKAKYNKVVEGTSSEEIKLARILVENAKSEYESTKKQQDVVVDNALNELNKRTYDVEDYEKNKFAYDSAVKTRDTTLANLQGSINQRQAELDVKLASAKNYEVDLAKADILSAEGQVALAQANLESRILRAPSNGTVTKVDIKLGELAQSLKQAFIIQDIGNLYIEANINEANIALLNVGQTATITYDALGPTNIFTAKVVVIEPSSTTTDGIVNYKIKLGIDKLNENIRPGMNANVTINTLNKDNVLVVPYTAIRYADGKSFVKKITNLQKGTYDEVEVKAGATGDGNLVEIENGLVEGDIVVVTLKK